MTMTPKARWNLVAYIAGLASLITTAALIHLYAGLATFGVVCLSLGGLRPLRLIFRDGLAKCPPSLWHTKPDPDPTTDTSPHEEV